MTIREATDHDLDDLVAMGLRFIAGTPYAAFVPPNPEQLRTVAQQLIASDVGIVLVLEGRGGNIDGMLGAMVSPHFLSGVLTAAELFWWVNPGARGYGVRLLRAFERWARDRGARVVQMISPSPDVNGLYERLGYTEMERAYQRSL